MRRFLQALLFFALGILFVWLLVTDIQTHRRVRQAEDEMWQRHEADQKAWNIKYLPEIYDENGNKRPYECPK